MGVLDYIRLKRKIIGKIIAKLTVCNNLTNWNVILFPSSVLWTNKKTSTIIELGKKEKQKFANYLLNE